MQSGSHLRKIEKVHKICMRQRTADVVALNLIALLGGDEGILLGRFDPFDRRRHAEARAAEASKQATENRAAAQAEGEAALVRARREAEQIVACARTQAEAITAAGNSEVEREISARRADLDRLTKRRAAITAQLSSLADLVAGFGEDES